jgi:hypothetical protein
LAAPTTIARLFVLAADAEACAAEPMRWNAIREVCSQRGSVAETPAPTATTLAPSALPAEDARIRTACPALADIAPVARTPRPAWTAKTREALTSFWPSTPLAHDIQSHAIASSLLEARDAERRNWRVCRARARASIPALSR